jgi:hypothetical protein
VAIISAMSEFEGIPVEERLNSRFCVEQFEENIGKLPRRDDDDYEFQLDDISLKPVKVTSVNLVRIEDNRFELLLAKQPRSGYAMKDHLTICNNNGIHYEMEKVLSGLFFETEDEKRYLIVVNIEILIDFYWFEDADKALAILDTLDRYHIETIFTNGKDPAEIDQWYIDKAYIMKGNYEAVDKLIFDDWTSNMAIELGWTNNELLRFRLTREVPKRKV